MKAEDLEIGEHGKITEGVYKNLIINRQSFGFGVISQTDNTPSFISLSWNKDIQVEKLENVKITYDGYPETKSEYSKKMIVSNNRDFSKSAIKTIVYKHGDWYFELPDYDNQVSNLWKFAKDIEKEDELVHLTFEDISNGKGVGVNPELIRIKK